MFSARSCCWWRSLAILAAIALAGPACASAPRASAPATVPKTATSEGVVDVEASDARLKTALQQLTHSPTAASNREVAEAYRALGIDDRAFDYLQAAIRLDGNDAGSHDLLARIWRDWGFPQEALVESRRALKLAPRSAIAHNTLGTIFEGMGLSRDARAAYWRAVELDGQATFALANLTRLLTTELAEARLRQPADTAAQTGRP
jgi:Flp pilus assembly protein TadD